MKANLSAPDEEQRLNTLLDTFKGEPDDVDESLQSLTSSRQKMFAALDARVQTLQIMDSLPNDIMLAIFDKCADLWNERPLLPLRLAQVCRHWRQLAVGCSSLWSSIVVGRRYLSLSLMELYLMRSRTVPLDILVTTLRMRYPAQVTQPLIHRLAVEAARWKRVTLMSGSRRFFAKALHHIDRTPLLIELNMNFKCDVHPDNASWDDCTVLVPPSPSLQRIALNGIPISAVQPPGDCPAKLFWSHYSADDAELGIELAGLRRWGHLTELHIWAINFPLPPERGVVELHALTKLTWRIDELSAPSQIRLLDALVCPALAVLTIVRLPCNYMDAFLGHLLTPSFPSLHVLDCRVCSGAYRNTPDASGMAQALFPPLRHITLDKERTTTLTFDAAGAHTLVTRQLQRMTMSFTSWGLLVQFVRDFVELEDPTTPFYYPKDLSDGLPIELLATELENVIAMIPQ